MTIFVVDIDIPTSEDLMLPFQATEDVNTSFHSKPQKHQISLEKGGTLKSFKLSAHFRINSQKIRLPSATDTQPYRVHEGIQLDPWETTESAEEPAR
jgi:hypothetical protein